VQQEKRRGKTVSQNITKRKGMVKDLRKPFIVPTKSSEPTQDTPKPSAWTVSERQADTIPEALNDTHHNTSVTPLDLPSNVSDLYKRLVVVTAYSSNHFEEGKGIIASVQKYMPQTKILLYDLGLTAKDRTNASTYCNVEVRTFQWDKYPKHVRQLSRYAWKPLIAREVSQEYDVIMYRDASVHELSHLSEGNYYSSTYMILAIGTSYSPISPSPNISRSSSHCHSSHVRLPVCLSASL